MPPARRSSACQRAAAGVAQTARRRQVFAVEIETVPVLKPRRAAPLLLKANARRENRNPRHRAHRTRVLPGEEAG